MNTVNIFVLDHQKAPNRRDWKSIVGKHDSISVSVDEECKLVVSTGEDIATVENALLVIHRQTIERRAAWRALVAQLEIPTIVVTGGSSNSSLTKLPEGKLVHYKRTPLGGVAPIFSRRFQDLVAEYEKQGTLDWTHVSPNLAIENLLSFYLLARTGNEELAGDELRQKAQSEFSQHGGASEAWLVSDSADLLASIRLLLDE